MIGEMNYVCESCGQVHSNWPALTYKYPDNYCGLSSSEKETLAQIDEDFCVITYPDQTDRFIRCTLTQKVNDHCEDLEYGLWVSLSEKSFDDYSKNFNHDEYDATYFGWLCNKIGDYESLENTPLSVVTRKNNQRPEIIPHKDFDHPFVRDYYQGISKKEAESRIQAMINGFIQNDVSVIIKKPWWKFW